MDKQEKAHYAPPSGGDGEGAVTLLQLLESRDNRRQLQQQLLAENPDKTLMVLTIVVPGPVKRNRNSLIAGKAAVEAINEKFVQSIAQQFVRDLQTGYEGWFLLTLPQEEAKRRACDIEDNHPLGRLFDIDIIQPDGTPMNRSQMERQPRKCLVCDNEARICMRLRKHPQQELQEKIDSLIVHFAS